MDVLKKINKYYIYVIFKMKQKISFIDTHNNKKELFKILKNKMKQKVSKDNFEKYEIVLINIKKVAYNPNQPIKMVFGPVKLEIDFLEFSNRGAIKANKFEKRNNHLFYTLEFLKNNKISKSQFKKVIELALENKLEKRLLAPKVIEQIN
tara:strand:+ start:417 stop:866 length:450 start_codon:yes stop_codon:yes gene_type:complete